MLAAQRRAGIVSLLDTSGAVSVSDLATRFEVSDMTIRRDLENLAEAGLIAKVHGGAVAPAAAAAARRTEEPGFEAKSAQMLPEKRAIAAAAAELLAPGMSVGLSAGTTTWALAHHLLTVPELTVVTNSPRIAAIFHRAADAATAAQTHATVQTDAHATVQTDAHATVQTDAHATAQTAVHGSRQALDAADPRVILTGGVRTPSDALVGPIANQALRSLHLDLVFLGTHGFSSAAGFTTPNLEEAETNRTMLQSGARAVVLADHSKSGTTALGTFARLAQIDTLISDTGLPGAAAAELREQMTLTLAETLADSTQTRRS